MKRVWVAVMVLVACLAIGSTGVATAKKKKKKFVTTSISLTVQNTPASTYSPGSATFSGQVSAGGPSGCRANRAVTISRNGAPVTSTTTQSTGSYSVTVGSATAPGQYTASVPKKVVKKGKKKKKKKFVCRAATSPPVTVQ